VQCIGPVQPEWKHALIQAGCILCGYVPENAFLVQMDARLIADIKALPFIARIVEYRPEYRIQPALTIRQRAAKTNTLLRVTIQTFDPTDISAASASIVQAGGTILLTAAGRRWGLVRADIPAGALPACADLPTVQWIEEYVPRVLFNDFAARGDHMNATNVWATRGLTGAGQVIGHADTGLDIGSLTGIHPDFSNRIRAAFALGRPGDWSDPDGHGTHTGGSILGNGAASTNQFRGLAWQAELVHQSVMDRYGGLGGLPADLNELYRQAYTNGARIHSDSWGSSVYGQYTTDSRQSDEFMWDHPDMLLVFSAGNDGRDYNRNGVVDGDSMGAPATAKNLLSVGAAENDRAPGSGGYSAYTYGEAWYYNFPVAPLNNDFISRSYDLTHQGMAAFSSRGPTDDGRIKPDIVAPGTDIISCRSRAPGAGSGWGLHPNGAYVFSGGTSMACPLTAGAAALVRQFWIENRGLTNPSAALVKATLLAGARSLAPGQYGTNLYREIPDSPRPNNVEGWGQVNLENSLFPAPPAALVAYADETAPASGAIREYPFRVDAVAPLTLLLAWTDYPATAGAGKKLVNDLDLVLATPDGSLRHANGYTTFDRTNNVEGIELAAPVSGVYTARVQAFNVPYGPQPYAFVARGAIEVAPAIRHTPLPNTWVTNQAYEVLAEITCPTAFDTNSVVLYWSTNGTDGGFTATPLTWVSNRTYRGFIPAQPRHSDVGYYISAGSGQFAARDPADAPAALHHFAITVPLCLRIQGNPAEWLAVTPVYGQHTVGSGVTIRAEAMAYSNLAADSRIALVGWTGQGSAPAVGISNQFEFVLRADSAIAWNWVTQWALFQTATVAGLVQTTTWCNADTTAATLCAPGVIALGATNYCFAQWNLDGLRQPNRFDVAVNPITNINMTASHQAVAVYLPEQEDTATNGLADWWELYYFGRTGVTPDADPDADTYVNAAEFADRSNPRDASSYPCAPVIQHTPLADPQPAPAPWPVGAVITDNYRVANARLFWNRGSGWQSAEMTPQAGGTLFTNRIPAPGADTDAFLYLIEARDPAGLTATSGPHAFSVHYPLASATPTNLGLLPLPAMTAVDQYILLTNSGSGWLNWTLSIQTAGLDEDVEHGTNGWNHTGGNDLWHISNYRYWDGAHAWYSGSDASHRYLDNMNASLITPPVRLGPEATLTFHHWASMEYDWGIYYWDGGIIELSTNNGTTYAQIFPIGGYPHRITANPASPFAPDTPCYGRTDGWQPATFDLAAWSGQTVRIRFRFGSDGYVVDEGWYIDRIVVTPFDADAADWIAPVQTTGAVPPRAASNLAVRCDTATVPCGEQRGARLRLAHNDPVNPSAFQIPTAVTNISRAIATAPGPHGAIIPSGTVYVIAGQSTVFLVRADSFYHVAAVATNGYSLPGPFNGPNYWLAWSNITASGRLTAEFSANILSNGVPEWWLGQYGLTNMDLLAESEADQDHDGMYTWQEYGSLTVPTNRQSVNLMACSVTPFTDAAGPGFIVAWYSFTNQYYLYSLFAAPDAGGVFTSVASNIFATPPINLYTDRLNAAAGRVYQIRLQERNGNL